MRTKLSAINEALSAIGLQRVTSLDSRYPSFIKALAVYERVSQEVQEKGWWFNRSIVTLQPNTLGQVLVPTKSVVVIPQEPRYVLRNRFLWDTETRTDKINTAVKTVLIELLDFDDLPPTAATYITKRTVYEHFLDEEGTEPKLTRYERSAMGAWAALKQDELKHAKPNRLDSPSIVNQSRSYGQRLRVR